MGPNYEDSPANNEDFASKSVYSEGMGPRRTRHHEEEAVEAMDDATRIETCPKDQLVRWEQGLGLQLKTEVETSS